jgi:peptidoglycan hydrolase-like protein with peptidoglycan-binding domain
MLDAAGLFGLALLWLLGGGGSAARPGGGGAGAKQQPKPRPQLPPGQQTSTAPPWPQAVPSGLPPFPGAGWQFDEPPPAAVVQRAGQLVSQLWSGGAGTFKIEQTGGRWIAYRAEIVKSGKEGVVAYRVKGATPAKPTTNTKDRAQLPPVDVPYLPPALQAILASTAPAPASAQVVQLQAGHWYQFSMLINGPDGLSMGIVQGLTIAGAVNIAVSSTAPYAVGYQLKPKTSFSVPLGVAIEMNVAGVKATMTYLRVVEISDPTKQEPYGPPPPPPAPAKPPPDEALAPPIMASTAPAAASLRTLPTLRRGDGIKPKPPNPDVKLMQQKLGILADGEFGGDTETALRAYQKAHKLEVDGVCGPQTWTSLLAGF